MKKKGLLVLLIPSLFFVSIFVSVVIVNLAMTTIFFDKFIFYKRIDYGYWLPNQGLVFKDFGERAKDMALLEELWTESLSEDSEANGQTGSSTNKDHSSSLLIALIGDSYTWGQGVKFKDTFSQKLEHKLGKITPTKVLSIASPGDNVLDYVINLEKLQKIYQPDYFVVTLVINDLLLNSRDTHEYRRLDFFDRCQQKEDYVWNLDDDELLELIDQEEKNPTQIEQDRPIVNSLVQKVDESWQSEANLCLLRESLNKFPQEKTLFFITDDYWNGSGNWRKFETIARESNRKVVSSTKAKAWFPYSLFFKNASTFFYVSEKEVHPSVIAHRMYAQVLYSELKSMAELHNK